MGTEAEMRSRRPRLVAAFDFDGTITKRDCLIPFLGRIAGKRRLAAAVLGELPLVMDVARGRTSRNELKVAIFDRLLTGLSEALVEEKAAEFAHEILASRLRSETLEHIAFHKRLGHELVVVSASLESYLRPVADALGFDVVLGVRLEVDPNGFLTGAMVGGNVRGARKVAVLEEYLSGEPRELWVFGDSEGDVELLRLADHPVWMGKPRKRPDLSGSLPRCR